MSPFALDASDAHAAPAVVLFGHGHWGQNLARVLRAEGALSAIVDPHPRRAPETTAVPIAPEIDALPATVRDRLEAAVIATPSALHADVARNALAAGLHVLVEKPLATRAVDAAPLIAAAEAAGLQLRIGHQLLSHPGYRALRTLVHEGSFGPLLSITATRRGLGHPRPGEDVLASFAPHDLAYLLDLCPGDVSVGRVRVDRGPNGIDRCEVRLGLSGGLEAQLDVRRNDSRRVRRLQVEGQTGRALFDELDEEHPLRIWRGERPLIETPAIETTPPLTHHLRSFLSACRQADVTPDYGSARSALQGLELIERIRAAARDRDEPSNRAYAGR